jgi:hypothetical protein
VEVGEEHDVGLALVQQGGSGILAVALQEKDSIAQHWVGEHTDGANVDQNGSMSDIVYLSQ